MGSPGVSGHSLEGSCPLIRRWTTTWVLAAAFAAGPAWSQARPAAAEPSRVLTLDAALLLTREHHPLLRATLRKSDAAAFLVEDAARWPNPSLEAGVENLGGGELAGKTESFVAISQPFEFGGDRTARRGLASARAEEARAGVAQQTRDAEAVTTEGFLAAWLLQERIRRLRAAEGMAGEAVRAASERLASGAAPPYERLRAESFLALREIERAGLADDLAAAKRRLGLQWNGPFEFDSLSLADPPDQAPASLEESLAGIAHHPARRAAEASLEAGAWRTRLARAARVPDLELAAGVRRLEESGATGFTAAISVPLPVWNPQSGDVRAAEAEHDAARLIARSTSLSLEEVARAAHGRWVTALDRWRRIDTEVQPATAAAMAEIASAYRAGRLRYLDIQEGQETLLEADLARLEAQADAWRAHAALARLLAPAPAAEESR
jgi:cobalt-zinc-cadmium efflux system outer membrane protein